MSDIREFTFEFDRLNLQKIIDALKDLSKIDPMIKMKLDKDEVLFYSKAGKDNTIHALKSFKFPVREFIIADEYIVIDFIMLNGPNFVKNLELFLPKKTQIVGKLSYKEKDKIASMFYITDGKLKFNFVTGDYRQIKDITKGDIDNKMDPENANFNFTIDNEQFTEIKKLIALNKSETISLRVKKGVLEFYDKRWSSHICDLPNVADESWAFTNKYLKSITPSDEIKIHMFDQFLLFKEDNVALMIGLELSELK
jgi:hypothetical protein